MIKETKVAVIGNGAVGMFLAGFLSEVNNISVWLACRRTNAIENINQHGIRLYKHDESIIYKRIKPILTRDLPLDSDIVIFCVKTTQLKQLLDTLSEKTIPKSKVISLMNGMGYQEEIIKKLGINHLLGGINTYGIVKIDDCKINLAGEGKIKLGVYHQRIDYRKKGLLKMVGDIFSSSGINLELSDDIKNEMWVKLAVNACINPITAIIRKNNGSLLKSYEYSNMVNDICNEIVNVAEKEGIKADKQQYIDQVYDVIKKTADNKSSMLQDIENNRETEIDAITGYIVEKGREHKIDLRLNESILSLINLIQNV